MYSKCFMSDTMQCVVSHHSLISWLKQYTCVLTTWRKSQVFYMRVLPSLTESCTFQKDLSMRSSWRYVPLRCDFRPGDIIAVTVGLHKGWYNQVGKDIDPRVGIADASGTYNVFKIHDVNDYSKWTPCKVIDGEDDNDLVSSGTPVPATFRLTFTLRKGYGVCETTQDNGYMNTAWFHSVIDVNKPLFLRLNRDDTHEEYYFYYFLVEVYSYNEFSKRTLNKVDTDCAAYQRLCVRQNCNEHTLLSLILIFL